MIPWIYHRLTPRDQAGDLLRVFMATRTITDAQVFQYRVPDEKVLLLNTLNIYQEDIVGSIAQIIFGVVEDTTTVYSQTMIRDVQVSPLGIGIIRQYARNGAPYLIVPPGHVLSFSNLNPSGAGCFSVISMSGLLVPFGTFSQ